MSNISAGVPTRAGVFLAPFHPLDEDPTLCIQRDLALMEHLDALGFDEAWIGEHHSGATLSNYGPSSGAATQRPRPIVIGTADESAGVPEAS
jgi:limonene 1,2-monooxygenase